MADLMFDPCLLKYDEKQLFNTQTVTALAWIERLQLRFKLRNQADGVGGVRAFRGDDG
jgi:hypothetical protein